MGLIRTLAAIAAHVKQEWGSGWSELSLTSTRGWEGAMGDGSSPSFETIVDKAYRQNIWVYRSINLVATLVAGLPWHTYRMADGSWEQKDSGKLFDLLMEPYENTSWNQYCQTIVTQLQLGGEAYTNILSTGENNVGGVPRQLLAVSPAYIRIEPGRQYGTIGSYRYSPPGYTSVIWTPEQVLALRYPDPHNYIKSVSPVEAAWKEILIYNEGNKWIKSLIEKGSIIPFLVMTKGKASEETTQALREWYQERHGGAGNIRPLILGSAEGTIEKPGLSPVDFGISELLREERLGICTACGVAPEMVGDRRNATYDNFDEARKSTYEETVMPIADLFKELINLQLAPRVEPGVKWDYEVGEIGALQEDANERAERDSKDVRSGIKTPGEIRRERGGLEDKGAEADVLLVDSSLVPLSMQTGQPEI